MLKPTCVIGNAPECDICVRTPEARQGTVQLSVQPESSLVTIKNDLPGVTLQLRQNDKTTNLSPGQSMKLNHGDSWELHGRKFRFDYDQSPMKSVGPQTPVKPFQLPAPVEGRTALANSPFKMVPASYEKPQPFASGTGTGPIGPQLTSLTELLQNVPQTTVQPQAETFKEREMLDLEFPIGSPAETLGQKGMTYVSREPAMMQQQQPEVSSVKPSIRGKDVFLDAIGEAESKAKAKPTQLTVPQPEPAGRKSPRIAAKEMGKEISMQELVREAKVEPPKKEPAKEPDVVKMSMPEIQAEPAAVAVGHALQPTQPLKQEKEALSKELKQELKELKPEVSAKEVKLETPKKAAPKEQKKEQPKKEQPDEKALKKVQEKIKQQVAEHVAEAPKEAPKASVVAKEVKTPTKPKEEKEASAKAKEKTPTKAAEAKEVKATPTKAAEAKETKATPAKAAEVKATPTKAEQAPAKGKEGASQPAEPIAKEPMPSKVEDEPLEKKHEKEEEPETPKKKAKSAPKKKTTPQKAKKEEAEAPEEEEAEEPATTPKGTPKRKAPSKAKAASPAKGVAKSTPKSTRKRRSAGDQEGGEPETPTMRTRSRK